MTNCCGNCGKQQQQTPPVGGFSSNDLCRCIMNCCGGGGAAPVAARPVVAFAPRKKTKLQECCPPPAQIPPIPITAGTKRGTTTPTIEITTTTEATKVIARIDPLTDVPMETDETWQLLYNCPNVVRNNDTQQKGSMDFVDNLNRYRVDRGLKTLNWDPKTALAAQRIASNASLDPAKTQQYITSVEYYLKEHQGLGVNRAAANVAILDIDPNVDSSSIDFFKNLKETWLNETEMGNLGPLLTDQYNSIGLGWYLYTDKIYWAYVIANVFQPAPLTSSTPYKEPYHIDERLYCECVDNTWQKNYQELGNALVFVNREHRPSDNPLVHSESLTNWTMQLMIYLIRFELPNQDFMEASVKTFGFVGQGREYAVENPFQLSFLDLLLLEKSKNTELWQALTNVGSRYVGAYKHIDEKALFYVGDDTPWVTPTISSLPPTSPQFMCSTPILSAGMSLPEDPAPTTRKPPCPVYKGDFRPDTCPSVRTYQYMEDASKQILGEANTYRVAKNLPDYLWSNNLAAAAQWHASYVYDNLATVETDVRNHPQGEATGHPGQTHGATVNDRALNANFEGNVYQTVHIAPALTTPNPMNAFCAFKDSYVSETDPGKFATFTDGEKPKSEGVNTLIGIGWKGNVVVFVTGGCGENYRLTQLYDLPEVGDVKLTYDVANTQQDGWYYLNGQTVQGDATSVKNARVLFGNDVLPNLTNTFLTQQTLIQPKTSFGANAVTLEQAQLPKVILPLSYIGTRANPPDGPMGYSFTGANLSWSGGGDYGGLPFEEFGTVLNPNATQAVVDNRPLSVGVRYMVFLDSQIYQEPQIDTDMPVVGDVKSSVHNAPSQMGWWQFGTTVSYNTTPTAYVNAHALFSYAGSLPAPAAGAVITLPDPTDATFVHDTTQNPGFAVGTNSVNIDQNNLPVVSYTGSIGKQRDAGMLDASGVFRGYASSGSASGTGGTASGIYKVDMDLRLNPNMTQLPVNVKGKYIPVRHLVYLGTEP